MKGSSQLGHSIVEAYIVFITTQITKIGESKFQYSPAAICTLSHINGDVCILKFAKMGWP